MTSILTVLIVGGLVLLAVRITAKQLAEPLHRIAAAKEGENKARAEDVAKIVHTLRTEIHERTDNLGRELDNHVERTNGHLNTLYADLERATGLREENDIPVAGGYHNSPDDTLVQPAVPPYDTGERTGAIMLAVGSSNQPTVHLTNVNDPDEIGEAILNLIRQEAPDAHPWTLHPTVQIEGQRWNWYDVARALLMRQYPGCMPPRNMHDLWPMLAGKAVWINNQPTPQEMTETARPAGVLVKPKKEEKPPATT